ncbi:glycine cleavage system protein GcvH [Nesterenkonia ebinurensis]|uniref:glycine cleavage system protein GcvH n=1 Tax=Nesterenkonia ebinurensis TaxID=2608252 RepID=UPI00123E280C|nr:glycine cleavage system protein GcvH [Nesterenkonia ebinurensis]
MSAIPENLKYTEEHEWIAERAEPSVVRIGITDYAQDSLGEVVYVEFPEVGQEVNAGDAVGEIESTKSVADIYTTLSGEVVRLNDGLEDSPETINADPYGAGWLFELKASDQDSVELLTAEEYVSFTD